jgi:hypothetical protein
MLNFFGCKVMFFRPPMSSFFQLRRGRGILVAKIFRKDVLKRLKLNFVLAGNFEERLEYNFMQELRRV